MKQYDGLVVEAAHEQRWALGVAPLVPAQAAAQRYREITRVIKATAEE